VRIIIEKPFGHDLESAVKLNKAVLCVFDEPQVYRIDHYLGKDTVQNLLVLRFGNGIFEPIWNRNFVDHVQITASEALGVEQRASFYENTGAVRDMIQSHMLQLTALVALEPPAVFDATAAVSYTHLDVYKRQIYRCTRRRVWLRNRSNECGKSIRTRTYVVTACTRR